MVLLLQWSFFTVTSLHFSYSSICLCISLVILCDWSFCLFCLCHFATEIHLCISNTLKACSIMDTTISNIASLIWCFVKLNIGIIIVNKSISHLCLILCTCCCVLNPVCSVSLCCDNCRITPQTFAFENQAPDWWVVYYQLIWFVNKWPLQLVSLSLRCRQSSVSVFKSTW